MYDKILEKLQDFIKKHYTQLLIKGMLLFLAFGLLFFLLITGIEYSLWLNSTGRFILLVLVVVVESFLFFIYIATPLFYLFKLKKGIGPKDAARMIGHHFPNVGDRLYNLLDLAENTEQSELLLASIAQRSEQLTPIPFTQAVDYTKAYRYAKYTIIPIVILILVLLSGKWASFFGSYQRVMNYDLAYEPPAPFHFELLSKPLNTIESQPFTIQVTTRGSVRPENVYLVLEDSQVLLQENNGIYSYTLTPPLSNMTFSFIGNGVASRDYHLTALKIPAITNFNMVLEFPAYLKRSPETLKSTGNAVLPEGTKVTWLIQGKDTEAVHLVTSDTLLPFEKEGDLFELNKRIYSNFRYQLTTSNENIKDYERLDYSFKVIPDAYPTITVIQLRDSLNPNVSYYSGEASDDYGLQEIALVYYERGKESEKNTVRLESPSSNFTPFYYTYPSGLVIAPGKTYDFYFEVTDNDGIHHGKTTKSQLFSHYQLNDNELENKALEDQQSLINQLGQSLEQTKDQQKALDELDQLQKEKNVLNFNDKNQIKDFLQQQEQQEQLMQKFSKDFKENLNKRSQTDPLNQMLQERLERQEIAARKNEKLLEELQKVAEKINKEELAKKLEELSKNQKNSERSLEQLLELTKRYYVTEKAAQLAKELQQLSEKQAPLSELKPQEISSEKEQQELNDQFQHIARELEDLKKDNEQLKKPIGLSIDEEKKNRIEQEQQKALEDIRKQENERTSPDTPLKDQRKQGIAKKQKSASEKMKEMSEELSQSTSTAAGSGVAEDAEMLRQILDNLVIFSFKQEALFDALSDHGENDVSQYSTAIKEQQLLRDMFSHVDDSLFALSMRQAELSEFVTSQITEVYYNMDKSVENIVDGQLYQGISYQKYVLTASNTLADYLANVLDNMQQSMQMGSGSGQGSGGFQLPDIIKGQGELGNKMGQSGQKEGQGQSGEGKTEEGTSKEGSQGKPGDKGDSRGENNTGNNAKGKEGKGENGGNEKQGSKGENGEGGGGLSETELQEIYEIYQQQQRIRQELEKQLENMINQEDRNLGKKLIKQMEDFENDLLENGITQRTLNKVNTIQHELLKLENAALRQGNKKERESHSNTKDFSNPIITKPSLLDNYHNDIEILNRQALPLRQNYQNKVKEYFRANDQF